MLEKGLFRSICHKVDGGDGGDAGAKLVVKLEQVSHLCEICNNFCCISFARFLCSAWSWSECACVLFYYLRRVCK